MAVRNLSDAVEALDNLDYELNNRNHTSEYERLQAIADFVSDIRDIASEVSGAKDLIESLEDKVSELEDKINELEEEVEELNYQLGKVESNISDEED